MTGQFKKGLFLKRFLLLAVFFATTMFVVVEIIKYDGFIKKHLLISLDQIFLFSVVLMSFLVFNNNLKNIIPNKYFLINKFLTLPVLFIYLLFTILETINYPNYVYSTFNINYTRIDELLLLCIILLIPNFYSSKYTTIFNKASISKKIAVIFFSTITAFALFQAQILIGNISTDIAKIVQAAIFSDKDRFEIKAGPGVISDGYKYTNFVIENTEPNSVIQIPPNIDAWKSTGNKVYMRGFLYPRVLIQNENDLLIDEADYILISKGLWHGENNGWPKQSIPKEIIDYIIYFDMSTGETTRYYSDYVHNNNRWGIIKLK